MSSLAKSNYLSELRALDWDFHGQSGQDGLAAYHWYPARYVPQVPGVLIGYLSAAGERVLDPFCGSGTTLVEARRLGREATGIDTNPVAVMTSLSKLVDFSPEDWRGYVSKLRHIVDQNLYTFGREEGWVQSLVPNYEEQSKWYHPRTLEELACIWEGIRRLPGRYEHVADVAFSSLLRFVCSQDKHWGWICDNVRPGEMSYRPVRKVFFEKLEAYPVLLQASLGGGSALRTPPQANVHLGKCAEVLAEMPDASFDLVVTSPPYFSMTDYMRSQRLTFLWHDWKLDELKVIESGARYKRHRQAALQQYLDEMSTSFTEIARVLKRGRSCAVVIGESPHRDPYLDEFRDNMVAAGFKIEARIKRRVATQRTFSAIKHEEIIIAKRT